MVSLSLVVIIILLLSIKFDVTIDVLYSDEGVRYILWYTSLTNTRKYKILF